MLVDGRLTASDAGRLLIVNLARVRLVVEHPRLTLARARRPTLARRLPRVNGNCDAGEQSAFHSLPKTASPGPHKAWLERVNRGLGQQVRPAAGVSIVLGPSRLTRSGLDRRPEVRRLRDPCCSIPGMSPAIGPRILSPEPDDVWVMWSSPRTGAPTWIGNDCFPCRRSTPDSAARRCQRDGTPATPASSQLPSAGQDWYAWGHPMREWRTPSAAPKRRLDSQAL